MASFELRFKQSVAKDLRSIPNKDVARILKRIEGLTRNPRPHGVEKLSAQDLYRIRQGIYGIVYEIKDDELIIFVVKIGHRRDVYRSC